MQLPAWLIIIMVFLLGAALGALILVLLQAKSNRRLRREADHYRMMADLAARRPPVAYLDPEEIGATKVNGEPLAAKKMREKLEAEWAEMVPGKEEVGEANPADDDYAPTRVS